MESSICVFGGQIDVTYIPKSNQWCISLGGVVSPTGAIGATLTLYHDPTNAAPKVIPGASYGGNIQVAGPVGYSVTTSRGQPYLNGPSIGYKGIMLNASYGACTSK
jgi:hypothetical protein